MAEQLDGKQALESTTVGIFRTASVVKGGRRFSFAALVVVGDRQGNIGLGYAKAPGVPAAIEKAQKDARKSMFHIDLKDSTLPHPVTGRFCSSKVRMLPAAPGTGVIAGGPMRAVLEAAGIGDVLAKSLGTANPINVVHATVTALKSLRDPADVARLRELELEELLPKKMLANMKAPAHDG